MNSWGRLGRTAHVECQKAHGGVTIDLRMCDFFLPSHGFAVKATQELTREFPDSISPQTFVNEFVTYAITHLEQDSYIGVFHNTERNTYEFDVVSYVVTKQEVDQIAKFSGAESAYEFHSGNGYFPNR